MGVDIRTEIIINRSIDSVAHYASDPDNATQWYVNIKSVEWRTPKPLQVGSHIAFKAEFMGKNLAYVYEVVENIPNERFVMRTADGPFPMETTYEWEKVEGGKTKMHLRNRGEPKGFSKFFSPLMGIMMRKANLKDLTLLKTILEKG